MNHWRDHTTPGMRAEARYGRHEKALDPAKNQGLASMVAKGSIERCLRRPVRSYQSRSRHSSYFNVYCQDPSS
jgi:hypothetical protein